MIIITFIPFHSQITAANAKTIKCEEKNCSIVLEGHHPLATRTYETDYPL